MHVISFLRKLFFLIIWLVSLFIIAPLIFFLYPSWLSSVPFFAKRQLLGSVIDGLALTISYSFMFGFTIFLVKRLFKFKKISRRGAKMAKVKIADWEKKKYPLKDPKDIEILGKIYELEKLPLSPEDKRLVNFIRTQLEADWQTPCLDILEEIFKKYK